MTSKKCNNVQQDPDEIFSAQCWGTYHLFGIEPKTVEKLLEQYLNETPLINPKQHEYQAVISSM